MIDIILIDYDRDQLSGSKMLVRGIKLIILSLAKLAGIKPTFFKDVYQPDQYAETIIKINKIMGIKTIVGINERLGVKADLSKKLLDIDPDLDIRIHIHEGTRVKNNRRRLWVPALNQSCESWTFEKDYCSGKNPTLREGDLPCFHFDDPDHVYFYIDFLFNRFAGIETDYKKLKVIK